MSKTGFSDCVIPPYIPPRVGIPCTYLPVYIVASETKSILFTSFGKNSFPITDEKVSIFYDMKSNISIISIKHEF